MEWIVDYIKLLLIFLAMLKVLLYGSSEIFTVVLRDKMSGYLQLTFKCSKKLHGYIHLCMCESVNVS